AAARKGLEGGGQLLRVSPLQGGRHPRAPPDPLRGSPGRDPPAPARRSHAQGPRTLARRTAREVPDRISSRVVDAMMRSLPIALALLLAVAPARAEVIERIV